MAEVMDPRQDISTNLLSYKDLARTHYYLVSLFIDALSILEANQRIEHCIEMKKDESRGFCIHISSSRPGK